MGYIANLCDSKPTDYIRHVTDFYKVERDDDFWFDDRFNAKSNPHPKEWARWHDDYHVDDSSTLRNNLFDQKVKHYSCVLGRDVCAMGVVAALFRCGLITSHSPKPTKKHNLGAREEDGGGHCMP